MSLPCLLTVSCTMTLVFQDMDALFSFISMKVLLEFLLNSCITSGGAFHILTCQIHMLCFESLIFEERLGH